MDSDSGTSKRVEGNNGLDLRGLDLRGSHGVKQPYELCVALEDLLDVYFTRLLYIQDMGGLHLSSLAVSEMIHGGVPCALYHYEERSIPHS